jgi:hypothetical protein
MEPTQAQEVENVPTLASVQEDAEGLICKVALLEGELVKGIRPRRWLRSSSIACPMHWLMVCDDWCFARRSNGSSSRSFPFWGLGCRVVFCHYWSITGEDFPINEDAGHHPLPY